VDDLSRTIKVEPAVTSIPFASETVVPAPAAP